jgi:hypothetical protein
MRRAGAVDPRNLARTALLGQLYNYPLSLKPPSPKLLTFLSMNSTEYAYIITKYQPLTNSN